MTIREIAEQAIQISDWRECVEPGRIVRTRTAYSSYESAKMKKLAQAYLIAERALEAYSKHGKHSYRATYDESGEVVGSVKVLNIAGEALSAIAALEKS